MTGVGLAAAACCFFLLSADAVKGVAAMKASSNRTATSVCPKPIDLMRNSDIIKTSGSWLPLSQIFVAGGAKCQVVGLVLDQQIGLGRRVRLVASQAIHLGLYLGDIGRIHYVGNWMPAHGMSQPVFQGEDHDLVLFVVILRQLHRAVEDGDHVLR